jgi:hypothetical protein
MKKHHLDAVYLLFNVKGSLFSGGETASFAAAFYLDKKLTELLTSPITHQ